MLAEMFCSLKAIEAAQSHHLSDRMSSPGGVSKCDRKVGFAGTQDISESDLHCLTAISFSCSGPSAALLTSRIPNMPYLANKRTAA